MSLQGKCFASTGSNSSMGTSSRGPVESGGNGGGPMRRRVSDKCTLPISAGTIASSFHLQELQRMTYL